MLRSNTKIVKERLRSYLTEDYDPEVLEIKEGAPFEEVAQAIARCFYNEYVKYNCQYKAHRISLQALFFEWCSGLCSAIDTSYFYNVSAVDLLGDILEETPAERAKYSESDAEKMFTNLLFRELSSYIFKVCL